MDIVLIKTFLEVASTGSFVAASDRLFVTQSAVSLRIQRLEDELGRALFNRSRAGAELTPAGAAFEPYALSVIKIWEEARQQVALPEGFSRSLTIGAQYSLWPRLGFRWIDRLAAADRDLSLRAETGMPDRLTRFLIEGVVQVALSYSPSLRPGLVAEEVLADELVLVAGWPEASPDDMCGRYVFVDWGPEFVHAHALQLPDLTHQGLAVALGGLALDYVRRRGLAAYAPARSAKRYIDAARLFLVPEAPSFPYPIWAVWRDDIDPALQELARDCLLEVAAEADAEQDELFEQFGEPGAAGGESGA